MDCLREVAAYGFPATQLEIQTGVGSPPCWVVLYRPVDTALLLCRVGGSSVPKDPVCASVSFTSLPLVVRACVSPSGRFSVFQIKTWAEIFISARKLPGQTEMV